MKCPKCLTVLLEELVPNACFAEFIHRVKCPACCGLWDECGDEFVGYALYEVGGSSVTGIIPDDPKPLPKHWGGA